ncbi:MULTISPECIES: polysaccharide deacetylase family protein [Thermoanaerobacterium]|uniref:Polysaccharide deacetylase n=2 Tax=Thermoanaerobacterium TaxID=28895 RepID=W9EB94_9THEO|nr:MULTISPECIES: polysaccharide deacetylase family protein [Thermoanaerobacterium]AFK86525.1 polysaccharide deacetylase [Thermoanaerobacterium saccharolyticum JW/SL-YS485]ETO38461.1 polysaccharide deacetylase [Thermoanaerobacterium aotearoense SCUT27]
MKIYYIKKSVIINLLAVFVLAFISILYTNYGVPPVINTLFNINRQLPIYSVDIPDKRVAISFDASWGSDKTERLLQILRDKNVKATFFLTGLWIDKYPDLVKKIYEEGHDVENHSNTHPHMTQLSDSEMVDEIKACEEKLVKITGRKPYLFRPPYGDYNDKVIEIAKSLGYYTIQWDVDSLDWRGLDTEAIINRVLPNVKKGSIILFHNNGQFTPEAIPYIIDKLKENGYQIVPISQLIYKENYYIDHEGRQHKKQ